MDMAGDRDGRARDTVSLFFSDFSDSHGAKEMLRAFKLSGKAVEVVIQPKRNKWGKRFGFVRFAEVNDPRIFAVKLGYIISGADKFLVNLPRFERDRNRAKVIPESNVGTRRVWKEVKEVKEGNGGGKVANEKILLREEQGGEGSSLNRKGKAQSHVDGKINNGRGEAKSHHARKFNNGRWVERQKQNDQKIVYFPKKNICNVWYNASEEELAAFKKMYVGVVNNAGSTHMV